MNPNHALPSAIHLRAANYREGAFESPSISVSFETYDAAQAFMEALPKTAQRRWRFGPPVPGGAQPADRQHRRARRNGVSEVSLEAAPTKWRVMARNRLVAAATGTTLVVEAEFRSGSRYTAGQARRVGRKVAAVPGPITSPASAGTNQLIRDGIATLVASPEDLMALMSRS